MQRVLLTLDINRIDYIKIHLHVNCNLTYIDDIKTPRWAVNVEKWDSAWVYDLTNYPHIQVLKCLVMYMYMFVH